MQQNEKKKGKYEKNERRNQKLKKKGMKKKVEETVKKFPYKEGRLLRHDLVIYLELVFPSTPSLLSSLFPSGFPANLCMYFLISHFRLSRPPFHHPRNIWRGMQAVKLITHFSYSHFPPVRCIHFLSAPRSRTS